VSDLARPFFSEPTRDNEPVRILVRPFVSELVKDNNAERDLWSELCSTRLEDVPSEPVNSLARPLISFPARDNEPVRILVRPFVSDEARENEPVRLRERPLTSEPARPSELVKTLPSVLTSEPAREIEPVRVRAESQPGVMMSEAVDTVVSVVVVVDVEPEYCIACQYSTARYLPFQLLKDAWGADIQVYFCGVVELITLLLVEVSQFVNRSVQLVRVLLPHCHTVIQILPTPAVELAAIVMSNCQIPDCTSINPFCIPAVL